MRACISINVILIEILRADEVIKNLLRHIYNKYQIMIRPKKDDHKFVLKAHGLREYFLGSAPLLSYDRVHSDLRGLRNLKLELILRELSSDYISCH